ncbi:hypothetical protein D3C71_734720 [compost metagenome]
MNKVLKIGIYVGVVTSLVSCGTSEHFMQDDVYNTRTPVMPPGTDLNDVTDYATFVAKKEQTETPPERTTYVSPREYRDFFYYSQFMYYGYPPYAIAPGISYIGYGYPNHYTGFGNGFYSSIGFGNYYGYNPYGYNPYGGYYGNYGYHPYGYDPYWNSPYYGNYGGGYYGGGYYGGGGYTYTQKGKPNTPGNLANSHAGTSAGRMGSTTNAGIVNYPHKMMINSGTPSSTPYNGVGRNTAVRANEGVSPVVNNGRVATPVNRVSVARPTTSARPTVVSAPRGDYQRSANPNVNSNQNSNTRTINNSTNNLPARTSTPTIRGGSGSSGGGGSTPSTGGGGRTGGRR